MGNRGIIESFKKRKKKKKFLIKKIVKIYLGISLEPLAGSVGSVQFQIAPRSSLHFSISIGPFWCSRC